MQLILSIDQGTSGTKALLTNKAGYVVARGSATLHTEFLPKGFVEQDPQAIWQNVLDAVTQCISQLQANGGLVEDIKAIGISNQRETFVVWDAHGIPVHPAIVWQCKRSVHICERLKQQGLQHKVQSKTGLLIDPYFSATKLLWLIENKPQVQHLLAEGKLLFGTVDTWLLYKMTGGKVFATDHTNASRTLFFNIHTLSWDADLIEALGCKGIKLPEIKDGAALFARTTLNGLLPTPIPVQGVLGDSHAAAFGEGCLTPGTAKATLGTGCSIMMNVGGSPVSSTNGMVSTICWSAGSRVDYALEGVIVSNGAALEWLKNQLELIDSTAETEALASSVPDSGGVYFIPAFSGLGSPHWQPHRRASITGLHLGSTRAHVVRAALEAIAFQIKDVVAAMEQDAGIKLQQLMVNGGMTANSLVMQLLADLLQIPVLSRNMPDVSALGAAQLAAIGAEWLSLADTAAAQEQQIQYMPSQNTEAIALAYQGWQKEIANYQQVNP